mgnify:FL=1
MARELPACARPNGAETSWPEHLGQAPPGCTGTLPVNRSYHPDADYVASATNADGSVGALVRLASETEFVSNSSDFGELAAALARTSVQLRSADIDTVVGATLDPQSGRPQLEVLHGRCGEDLRVLKLELYDQQPAVVSVETSDSLRRGEIFGARGVVLAQWFHREGERPSIESCRALARRALQLDVDQRRSVGPPFDPVLREGWALDETLLDDLVREHAPQARWVRFVTRWSLHTWRRPRRS